MRKMKCCEKCGESLFYIEILKDKTLTKCNKCDNIEVENWL